MARHASSVGVALLLAGGAGVLGAAGTAATSLPPLGQIALPEGRVRG